MSEYGAPDGETALPPSKFGSGFTVGGSSGGASTPSVPPPPPFPGASYPPLVDGGLDSGLRYPAPAAPPPPSAPPAGGLRYPEPVVPAPLPPPPVGYPVAAMPGVPVYGVDALAPYGRDPFSGEPLSDKSKVTAGLLQLFFGQFGVGRFYLGYATIGGIQLGLWLLGFVLLFVFVGIFVLIGVGIWALIDAIMMFTGSVPDAQGRKLRA